MSIESQIEAAWKEESPKVRESLQCSRASQVLGAAEIGFTAGYLAALRSLYVEVKPEDCREHEKYWIEMDKNLFEAVYFPSRIGGYFQCTDTHLYEIDAVEVRKILRFNLPYPSDIFGRGE